MKDTKQRWPEVEWFAEQMRRKLDANADKRHWDGTEIAYLLGRLHEEIIEVDEAIENIHAANASVVYPADNTDWQALLDECSDVANFAMMIADHARSNMKVDLPMDPSED